MRIIFAARSTSSISRAAELLASLPNLEFRLGSVPEVSDGCDAQIMHFSLAHDRYGGSPVVGRAQVLQNLRADGAPPIIIATPPLEDGAGSGSDTDRETERHAERMIKLSLDTWIEWLGTDANVANLCCLIHMEGAGLDFGPLDSILQGLADAIRPFITSAD